MKRSILVAGALSAAFSMAARADDLTVSTALNKALKTSTASNNSPGNIDVESNGSVTLNTSGAVVTVDSSNTLINDGLISNPSNSGAIDVHLLAGNTSGLSVTGSLYAGVDEKSTNSIGVLLDGTGTFTGSITFSSPAAINVTGANSVAVALYAPIVGDVTLGATISNYGAGTSGVVITAPITGILVNSGNILASGTATYDNTKIDPQAGWGMALGASISGGFLNTGPVDSSDTTLAATITSIGSKPALYISPAVAGSSAADLTIGLYQDTTNSGYSFLNRGSISASGNDPGVDTVGAVIEGTASFKTTLTGPIYNRGTIRGDATSSNFSATSVPSAAADGTGLVIGLNAIAPGIQNDGVITGTTTGDKGGRATGILIQAGASLPQIVNSSFISALANTSDTSIDNLSAYAIQDLSGTLTNVVNTGAISATGTTLDSGAQTLVAVDLSHATSAVTFYDSGTIQGDVLFGSGANTFTIDGATAQVTGRFRAAGGGTLDVELNDGKLKSDDTEATTVNVGPGGSTEFALSKTTASAPLISATGNVSYASGAKVVLSPTSFLPDTGTYTLVSAGGSLTFDDFAGSTTLAVPYLFTGGFAHDQHNLTLTLTRKNAAQLGLSGNLAAIYEPAALAASLDDAILGQHLLALSSSSQVQQTLGTMLPNIGAGSRALMVAVTDQATGPIGERQRDLVTIPRQGVGFWSQQFYDDVSAGTDSDSSSYFGSGLGLAMGVEWGESQTGRYGVGYSYFAGQVTEKIPRATKEDVSLNMFTFYAGWRVHDFFITPQVNAGVASFTGHRQILAGGLTRVADGDWDAYVASGGVSTGYIFNFGPVQVIPQISVDGMYVYQSSYDEFGGGDGVNLSVGRQEMHSVRVFAGVVAQSNFALQDGTLQPRILAGWSRDFYDDAPVIDATFQALPGSPFSLVGPSYDPSKVISGASFSYIFNNWTAGLNYDASRTSGSLAQSATVMLTSRF